MREDTRWCRNDLNHNSIPDDPRRSRRGVACRLDNLGEMVMKHFYAFMLWMTRFDLAIARSTGRNPANIAQLQREELVWERELWNCQHRLNIN